MNHPRLKLYFVTLFIGYGCLLPYLTLYYRNVLGFTSAQIGLLTAIVPVMNFLLTPQWTWVADRLQNHRTVLAVNNVGSSLAAVGLVALRPASTTIATTTSLGDSSVDDGTATFIWAIMAVAAFAACLAPLNSILDLVVLRVLQGGAAVDAARTSGHVNAEASGDAEVINGTVGDTSKADGHDLAHYGQQRMWGSLAYGGAGYIVAALMGPSLSQSRESNGGGSDTSGNAASAFHTIFYAYMIAVGVCFTAVLYWPQGTRQSGWREHVGGATAGAVKPTTSAAATATAPLESAIIERSSATNTGDNAVWLSMSRSGELESNAGAVTATASSPHSCRRESTISLQSFTVPPVPALATLSGVPKEEKVAATSFFGAVKTIYAFESTAGSATSFWLFIFIMGFTLAIINNYTFLMLVDKLHADSNLLGVISLARITLEIPFFFWSGSAHDAIVRWVGRVVRIEGRFKQEDGMRWTLVIAMVVLVVRVGMYSAMSYFRWNAWVDVGVELLHGMIYALFYSAAVQLSSILAPPNLQATAQGIFGAIFSGFGSTLGTFVGGMVYDVMGPTTLFTGLMVMNAVMVVVFVGDILKSRRSPSSKASDVGSDGFLYVGSPLSDVSTMSATSSDRPFGSSQLLVRD